MPTPADRLTMAHGAVADIVLNNEHELHRALAGKEPELWQEIKEALAEWRAASDALLTPTLAQLATEKFQDALSLLGFTVEGTGGGCDALIARYSDELVHVITETFEGFAEPIAPTTLDAPVCIGTYTVESWDEGMNGDATEVRNYATLRECLVELYGNSEGNELPECLR